MGKQYHIATKPLYSAKQVSEPMTLAEARLQFTLLTVNWTAQAKSADLRHMDNGDTIWIERIENADTDEPRPIGIFERDS